MFSEATLIQNQCIVLGLAHQLNEFGIYLTLGSHIACDQEHASRNSELENAIVSLPHILQDRFVSDKILALLPLCRMGGLTDNLFQQLLELQALGYNRSYYYLLNFLSPDLVLKYLESCHLPLPNSVFEHWVLAKYSDLEHNQPDFKQPMINTHHHWLSASSFSIFSRKTKDYSPCQRIFTSQPCVSNGHIDLLMPSIYEYILSGIKGNSSIKRPPLLICDIEKAANKDIVKRLIEAELIEHQLPKPQMTSSQVSRISNSSDFIELTHTCQYLSHNGVVNVYTNHGLRQDHEITKNVREIVASKMQDRNKSRRYTLLHSRDSLYKGQRELSGRDSDFNVLAVALSRLGTASTQPFVRMGESGVSCIIPPLLAYDKTVDRYRIADDILLSNCSAFIGTTSGPGHYSSSLFGKRTLLLNATVLAASSLPSRLTIFSLKHIHSLVGSSRQEKIDSLLDVWFDSKKAQFRDLTVHETLQDLVFFNEFVAGSCVPKDLYMLIGDSTGLDIGYLSMTLLTPRCYENLIDVLG